MVKTLLSSGFSTSIVRKYDIPVTSMFSRVPKIKLEILQLKVLSCWSWMSYFMWED